MKPWQRRFVFWTNGLLAAALVALLAFTAHANTYGDATPFTVVDR